MKIMKKLQPREKRALIVGGLALLFIALTAYLYLWDNSLWNRWQDLQLEVGRSKAEMKEVDLLHRQYRKLQRQVDSLTTRMTDENKRVSVKGFAEKLIQEKAPSAAISGMKTTFRDIHDLYRLTTLTVKLKNISLPELVDVLYGVVTAPQPLKVRKLNIFLARGRGTGLDVDFTVVTATPI